MEDNLGYAVSKLKMADTQDGVPSCASVLHVTAILP